MLRHADVLSDGEGQPCTNVNSSPTNGSHRFADACSRGSPCQSPLAFLPPDRILAAKASAAALAASAVRAGFAAGLRASNAQRPSTTGFTGPNVHALQGSPRDHVGSRLIVQDDAVQTGVGAHKEVEVSEEEEEQEEVGKMEEALLRQAIKAPEAPESKGSKESEESEGNVKAEEQREEQENQKQEGQKDKDETDEQHAKSLNEDSRKEQGMDTVPACSQVIALDLGGSAPETSSLMLAPEAAELTVAPAEALLAESDDDVWEVLVQRTFINVVQKQRAAAHTMSAPARLIAAGSPEGRQRRGYSPARNSSRRRRRRSRRRSGSRQHGLLARSCAQPLGSLPPARARTAGAAEVTLVPLG